MLKRFIIGFVLSVWGLANAGAVYGQSSQYASLSAEEQQLSHQLQLDRALARLRFGHFSEGLISLHHLYRQNPKDHDVMRLLRLNASRYAIRISEDCDLQSPQAHCDTALKYNELARGLGDSAVYHEVKAMALYQKLQALEARDFERYREAMPARTLTPNMAYRYLPEERRVFFKNLIDETMEELRIARGDEDRADKLAEMQGKVRIIERSTRMVGSR